MNKVNYNLKDLPKVASRLLEKTKSKTLLFYGEMGVGKTTLIKELIKQLGSDDIVTSPTFSLVNEYALKDGFIFHFDFYRIENEIEALDIGIEEYFDRDCWIFIEWPEKISNFLPEDRQTILIERTEKGTNILNF